MANISMWHTLCGAALAAVMAVTSPAQAVEAPMGAAEFDAYVTGHTVTFFFNGRAYGVEQYMPGRHVVWRAEGGECKEGIWFQKDQDICFDYGSDIPLQCWQFFDTGTGLNARSTNTPDGPWIYEAMRSRDPMQCPAPYVGS